MINELTALKKTPTAHKDTRATNALRIDGTRNLVAAARQLGASRFVTQSMVFGYGFGDWGGRVLTEADPFGPPGNGRFEEHVAAMRCNERQMLDRLAVPAPLRLSCLFRGRSGRQRARALAA